MSSPEYLRRHYGVVPPTAEAPRISAPENLARRTAAIVGIYEPHPADIPVNPKPKFEKPSVQILRVGDPNIAGGILWSKRQAAGARTVKKADFMSIPEQVPDIYVEPR